MKHILISEFSVLTRTISLSIFSVFRESLMNEQSEIILDMTGSREDDRDQPTQFNTALLFPLIKTKRYSLSSPPQDYTSVKTK